MNDKKIFREKYRKIRREIEPDIREDENQMIFTRVTELEEYKKAKTVFAYVSVGDEADTQSFIEKALEDGKYVTVPVCNKDTHTMSPALIRDMEQLQEGAYGIPEPAGIYDVVEKSSIDFAVVPGLCFDKEGYRVGYGGGYYDRFLEDYKGFSVGLAFSDCIAEKVPAEDYDCRVDLIVSGKRK